MDIYNMEIISHYVPDQYNKETYVWSYWEAECDDWYMDSCHFQDDNHFNLLFDDSTPPYIENILESRQEPSMHILLQFSCSPVIVDEFLAGSTYLDPHDQCRHLEHHFSTTYCVPVSSKGSSHEHLDMGPQFTMDLGLLPHGG
jgi:hypothetical protein